MTAPPILFLLLLSSSCFWNKICKAGGEIMTAKRRGRQRRPFSRFFHHLVSETRFVKLEEKLWPRSGEDIYSRFFHHLVSETRFVKLEEKLWPRNGEDVFDVRSLFFFHHLVSETRFVKLEEKLWPRSGEDIYSRFFLLFYFKIKSVKLEEKLWPRSGEDVYDGRRLRRLFISFFERAISSCFRNNICKAGGEIITS